MHVNNHKAIKNFCNIMLICLSEDSRYFDLRGDSTIYLIDQDDKDLNEDLITLLANNGCRFSDDIKIYYAQLHASSIDLIFIHGALGNETNEFFDYVETDRGLNALVIFNDHFANMVREGDPLPEDPIQRDYIESFGNSGYYDDIKRLADIYMALISNPAVHMNMMSATAAANMYRWNSSIIAAYIIDKIKPITDADISDMDINVAKRLITELDSRLRGVRILPGEEVQ